MNNNNLIDNFFSLDEQSWRDDISPKIGSSRIE